MTPFTDDQPADLTSPCAVIGRPEDGLVCAIVYWNDPETATLCMSGVFGTEIDKLVDRLEWTLS